MTSNVWVERTHFLSVIILFFVSALLTRMSACYFVISRGQITSGFRSHLTVKSSLSLSLCDCSMSSYRSLRHPLLRQNLAQHVLNSNSQLTNNGHHAKPQTTHNPQTLIQNQCCCSRGNSLSSTILQDQFTSPCPSTSSPCHKVVEKCWGLCIVLTFCYVRSREVYKFGYCHRAWGYGEEWLTYIYIYISVSKPFFTVTQCCCPRGKSLSLRILRTNLQVLVLILGPQVLVLVPVFKL